MDSAVRSAAGAGSVVYPAYIAGTETDQRSCVLAKRCEYQLADLAGFEHLSGVNVHRFDKDVIFGDM